MKNDIETIFSKIDLKLHKIKKVIFDKMDSTQNYARLLQPVDSPLAILARTQEAGVGRVGKWISVPGKDLSVTYVFPAISIPITSLPLIAGLSIVKTLKIYGYTTYLKWSNDVLDISFRKVAGVLCESAKNNILIGIGINLNSYLFKSDHCNIEKFCDVLSATLSTLINYSVKDLHEIIEEHLIWKGRLVKLSDVHTNCIVATGQFLGIDELGGALVKGSNAAYYDTLHMRLF